MKPSSDSAPGAPNAPARKCVLVVEDELLIRFMLSEELRDAGYHVIEAFNADEALAILESLLPDAIVSDVRMPGRLDGIGLLAAVREMFPTLPVIITSGHAQPARAAAHGVTKFIPKPYMMESVVRAVQDELDRTL
jgi:CheY-like chemotaxis protein